MLLLAVRDMSCGSFFVKLSSTVLARDPVIDFVARFCISTSITATATIASTPDSTTAATASSLWLAKAYRLPSSHHRLTQLIALCLPLADWSACFLLLNLPVYGGTSLSHLYLLAINNTLLASIEDFALLTENFFANVFMLR